MFGRHEYCKKVLESGYVCPCDCGDQHGSKYVPGDLNTPIHVMTMKIIEAHKRGERYTVTDDDTVTPVIELNYQVRETETEPPPLLELENDDVEDTLEQLEAKRD